MMNANARTNFSSFTKLEWTQKFSFLTLHCGPQEDERRILRDDKTRFRGSSKIKKKKKKSKLLHFFVNRRALLQRVLLVLLSITDRGTTTGTRQTF